MDACNVRGLIIIVRTMYRQDIFKSLSLYQLWSDFLVGLKSFGLVIGCSEREKHFLWQSIARAKAPNFIDPPTAMIKYFGRILLHQVEWLDDAVYHLIRLANKWEIDNEVSRTNCSLGILCIRVTASQVIQDAL